MKRYISKLRGMLRSSRFAWNNGEEQEIMAKELAINSTAVLVGTTTDKNANYIPNQIKDAPSDGQKSIGLIAADNSEHSCSNADLITSGHAEGSKLPDSKKTWKDLVLYDIDEHPMLKQELVAIIDGRYIQFRLISVDPKILLQEPLIINAEPIPSLIWPYD